jgi:hypothetical protein
LSKSVTETQIAHELRVDQSTVSRDVVECINNLQKTLLISDIGPVKARRIITLALVETRKARFPLQSLYTLAAACLRIWFILIQ